ncbi:isopropanol dehydrogenase [Mytilinidion resinicola]|uniref:Isopropanol dehydrogenase n=1 Tax=Mytilinidion resinicola TaxID=574789 RepID=A0A6A6ZB62_9PEZI|nr:isopropanol dehydrogenase [Mytilinidion resinicola]KAF2817545.1 isopropanol dehydrogenase [Mytilinidion resinicola]
MTTHKALLLSSLTTPISLQTVPTPSATPGSATLRVLAAGLQSYARAIFTGALPYALALPQVPGASCVARVLEVGPDATALLPGQLVWVDATITARDDADCNFLLGLHGGVSAGSQKLMRESWRDGCYAEIVKAPLENCYPLDEALLTRYGVEELAGLSTVLVPFGGLEEAGVGAGTTVIVAPATGKFSGGAVLVALAMGARVVAAGRSAEGLEKLKSFPGAAERLVSVRLVSDVEEDAKALFAATGGKGAKVYMDLSPPAAGRDGTPTHVTACLGALKRGGTALFMGGIQRGVEVPYGLMMFRNLTVKGKFMYERTQAERLIKMVEFGNLTMGKASGMTVAGTFGLEEIEEALDFATERTGWGGDVVLVPNA